MKSKWKPFMEQLALGAGAILLKYFNKPHRIERKRNAGIVTEADKAAEAFLLKKIFRNFSDSSIITEESGEFHRSSSLTWVLDPLDGTTNYAHGFPWFCVSIGLYEAGKPIAGMIYQPLMRELFYAEAGKGADLNGKRIRVSKVSRMNDSLLGTGFYYSKGSDLQKEMKIFSRFNEHALGVRRPGSAAMDLAYVACGRYDGFWERRLSSWDVAAGFLLVTEAGGTVSNYKGGPTTLFEGEALASNGRLHGRLVKIISGRLQK
jgi:myo-inositol-1(or 4)-monophosphatase